MVNKSRVEPFVIRDLEALRVVSDPLRVRILGAASQPASVKEIGKALKIAPGKLYYHVELLERHGLLVVDSTRLVSGITEKRYRAVAHELRVDRRILGARAPREAFEALMSAVLDATRIEAERSVLAGVLAVEETAGSLRAGLFSRTQIRLTPQRATELRAELEEAIARAQAENDDNATSLYDLTVAFFPIAPSGE